MPRLVLLVAVALGWLAYDRLAKTGRGQPGPAFPFPTGDSHDTIVLGQSGDAVRWCHRLGCTEAQLHGALRAVGSSARRVREHLAAG